MIRPARRASSTSRWMSAATETPKFLQAVSTREATVESPVREAADLNFCSAPERVNW